MFFSKFPKHFKNNFSEGKYGGLVKKNDHLLLTVIADGMHQNQTILEYIRQIQNLKRQGFNYTLMDYQIKIFDIIKNFFLSIDLINKMKYFEGKNFTYKNIDISKYILQEIGVSFLRIPRLLIHRHSFIKILKKIQIKAFIYYLFEFSYGKYFNYLLVNYFPQVERIGFQHGAPSKRKMLCFLSEGEIGYNKKNFLKYLPMPNSVWVENEYFKTVYEEAGYRNFKIIKEVPRLEYLEQIKRLRPEKNTVLIACGMHDYELIFRSISKFLKKKMLSSFLNFIQEQIIKNLQ